MIDGRQEGGHGTNQDVLLLHIDTFAQYPETTLSDCRGIVGWHAQVCLQTRRKKKGEGFSYAATYKYNNRNTYETTLAIAAKEGLCANTPPSMQFLWVGKNVGAAADATTFFLGED